MCKVIDCDKKSISSGLDLCSGHYQRFRRYGDPLAGRAVRNTAMKTLEEMIRKETDECIVWPFARLKKGYGAINSNGNKTLVHRIACELVHGKQPEDKPFVRHLCGNGFGGCFNPRHLCWGTAQENSDDRIRHEKATRGEDIVQSKLTEKQVLEIDQKLKDGYSVKQLREEYECTRNMIERIRNGRNWSWLTGREKRGGG